ncbi:hypothetical protein Tco_1492938 [Tanacetum coccineum]
MYDVMMVCVLDADVARLKPICRGGFQFGGILFSDAKLRVGNEYRVCLGNAIVRALCTPIGNPSRICYLIVMFYCSVCALILTSAFACVMCVVDCILLSINRQTTIRVNLTFVEPFNLVEPIENQAPPVVTMDDTRTMAQLLEAPTVGYEDAIIVPEITAGNFELKHDHFYDEVPERPEYVAPAPVKAVEESCVTCGGAHSYRNCPATDGNVYRDNIQEYVSQAAAANFNQGNTGYRAPIANQIRPPGFPPVQQNQGNNQNRYNQNRGNNYNQGQIYRPPINQPLVPQAPLYQALAPQTQGVSKDDFQNYVKANDAVMRNMQNQNQNLQNQMTNLTDMLSKFLNSNTASTSGSGTLTSNTITNSKVDLKGITTQSGVTYQGSTSPTTSSSPPKVVERETEVTKDTTPPTNNRSTKDVQPSVVQIQSQVPNSEPVVAPVSAPMPNPKPSIPYPSRRNDERHREKAND